MSILNVVKREAGVWDKNIEEVICSYRKMWIIEKFLFKKM